MLMLETQASQLARALNDTQHAAAVGYLDLDLMHLYRTETILSPTIPLATLAAAEANFTGYAATVIVWETPSVADDGTVEVVGTVVAFRPSDAVAPNNVWGCYVTNAADSVLHFCGQFDNPPLPMVSALNVVLLTVRYRPATGTLVVVTS